MTGPLFQEFPVGIVTFQHCHLMDGDCIEPAKPFCLWKPIVYENGVQAFHIGQADELVNGGIITNVSLEIGIGVPPFSRRHAEQGD